MKRFKFLHKSIKGMVTLALLTAMVVASSATVWAEGLLSIAVSKSSMNVGDIVVITVYSDDANGQATNSTMKVTYDSSMLEYVSSSASSASGGGGAVTATGSEIEYTFKAVGSGTAAIQATAEAMTAAGVKIQVAGSSTSTATTNDTTTTTDTSTTGTTSESTSTDTTANDTTTDATTGTTENTGDTDTATTTQTSSNTGSGLALADDVNAGVTETTGIQISLNDTIYEVSDAFSESDIPEGFTAVEILYGDGSVSGINNATGSISMFYLVNTTNNADQGFYVYDSTSDSFYPFVRVYAGNTKVQIIKADSTANTSGYTEGVSEVSGKAVYSYSGEDSTFSYFYCADVSGNTSWYQFDAEQQTIQRAGVSTSRETSSVVDYDTYNALKEKYNTLSEQ
ncbi:MAG: hypothetical protein K6F37_07020 [Lachnospiraceae bacterium]|nr:hypothetical protein [Lachnospiraceae bacterium]